MPHDVVNLGPSSVAFPIVGAAQVGRRLHLVSRNLSPARMVAYDLAVERVVETVLIPEGAGAWGVAADGDRSVYLGQFGARARPNLYRYDRATRDLRAVALLDVDYIWSLAVAGDGSVFGVTAPDMVFRYDPSTDRVEIVRVIDRMRDRVRSIAAAGGRVYVGGARDGSALLLAFDRGSTDTASVLPPALAGHESVYVVRDSAYHLAFGTRGPGRLGPAVGVLDRNNPGAANVAVLPDSESVVDAVLVGAGVVWCTARPSGALYRFDLRTQALDRVAEPVAGAETRGLFDDDGGVVGVSSTGHVWRHRPGPATTDVTDVVAAGAPAGTEQPQALAAGNGEVYAGGNFSFSVRDLRTLAYRRHVVPGEPKDLAVAGSTVYVPLYPVAQLWAYASGTATLGRVLDWPAELNRPVSIAVADLRGPVAISARSDARGDGAVILCDPVTRTVRTFEGVPGPGQHPAGLAIADGVIAVGGSGADPAFAALDADSGAVRWRVGSLAPATGTVAGVAAHEQRLYAMTADGWVVAIDPVLRRVAAARRVAADGGRIRSDGMRLWAATRTGILEIHPRSLRARWAVNGPSADVWGWPLLATSEDGAWFGVQGRNLVRVRPV